ncbi:MAG: TVP38/TMEM64 family protein [Flavobacteriaceae bacterium]
MDRGFFGSQHALTLTVLTSRLVPFISFDVVSYAAGLSRLHLWRFFVATLAGIIPASFLLAHFGDTAINGSVEAAAWAAVGLGVATAAPLILGAARAAKRKHGG